MRRWRLLPTSATRAPAGEAGRIFLCYLDDTPPTYFIDGLPVGAGEWHERASVAGASSFVVKVVHAEMERAEG